MKILFDHGTPASLRRALLGHSASTASEMGWSELDVGTLLSVAEVEIDAITTTDQSIRYQQNLSGRRLAIFGIVDNKLEPNRQAPIRNTGDNQ